MKEGGRLEDIFLLRTKKEYEDHLNTLIQNHQYKEALDYLDKIEYKVVETVWLNYYRGALYNALSQPHLALPYLLKAQQQGGESADIYRELGWTYNRLEEFDLAIDYLEKANVMKEESFWLDSELAYSYLKKGMFDEAIIYLQNSLEFEPEDEWTLNQLANAYNELEEYEAVNEINKYMFSLGLGDEDLVQEIIAFNEMLHILDDQQYYLHYYLNHYQDKAFGWYHLAIYYNMNQEAQKAIEALNKIPISLRDKEIYMELGYSYRRVEEYSLALDNYLSAYQYEPDNMFIISELAYLYGVLDDDDTKLYYLDKAKQLGRDDLWLYLNYARIYLYSKKDSDKARYYLDEAKKCNDGDEEYLFLEVEYLHLNRQTAAAYQATLTLLQQRTHSSMMANLQDLTFDFEKVIPVKLPNIERIYEFYNGLAYIENHQKSGFINEEGQLVIDMIYAKDQTKRRDTYMFFDKTAIVCQENNHLFGLIDTNGKTIIETIYDNVEKKNNWIKMTLGDTGIFSSDGKEYLYKEEVKMMSEDRLAIKKEKWGYLNADHQWCIDAVYDEADDFKDGYARVKIKDKYGFIDMTGKRIIPCQYQDALYLNEHLFALKNELGWQVFNAYGQPIHEGYYEDIDVCFEHYIGIKKNEQWGYMNTLGKIVIDCQYDEILPFFEARARVKIGNYYGVINPFGEMIIPCIYDMMTICKQEIIIAGVGYRYGLFNQDGRLLTPIIFQTATLPVKNKLSVSYHNQFYIVDIRGIKK